MGAFDTYEGEARCPRCGDVHHVEGQTKFFVPDFFGLYARGFRPGAPQPIDFATGDLRESSWDGSWVRVQAPGDPGRLDLLADLDDCFGCDCGACFAVVLRFRVSDGPPASAMLTAIELRETSTAAAVAVDFADAESRLWAGDHAGFAAALAELGGRSPEARAAWVREGLRARFDAVEPPEGPVEPPAWFTYDGEVRCEACGERRRRSVWTALSHPSLARTFFGAPPASGALAPGVRVACDLEWLKEDVDRGYYVRLRHPVPEDRLTVIEGSMRAGCRCGAGRAAPLLRFAREPGALVLQEVALRVVRGAEDLADVDFAQAGYYTRDVTDATSPRRWEWTREVALAGVLSGLVARA